ncbi:alpha/beta hydrolase [Mycobacterium hubeiense]|uniref:alpha/beta hydrolase n=1 Tax=Mycobacterium hubeiense TaxID=1867256 RepID=UPI001E525AFE|nr:alpha/beta hydrolase [Mycobacterium sp. QGD 101]
MITATLPNNRERMRHVDTIDGFGVPVELSGPDNGRVVIMFEETHRKTDAYDIVRERLHVAMLRTLVIPADPRLTAKSVVGILDQLKIPGGLLVGDRTGGELAWNLAASQQERFTGLVVIDCGHPRAPDIDGVVRDRHCPAVQADATALVSTRAAHAVACESKRYVHGEFRLAELAGPRRSRHFIAQLATEIVVRSLSR